MDIACFERTGDGPDETTLHVGVAGLQQRDAARERVQGFSRVNEWLRARCERPGSLLIRDHYQCVSGLPVAVVVVVVFRKGLLPVCSASAAGHHGGFV